jgi:DNA invertase Pin-like site-specific DNA recombinase
MARSASSSIDDVVRSAMEKVMKRVSAQIARAMAEMAASQVDREISQALSRGRRGGRAGRPARRAGEISRWSADRRARRVPKFVIEMTNGLDTKKKIVAKFGEGATFEKGKPLPRAK